MHRRTFHLSFSLLLVLSAGVWAAEGNRLTADLFLDWEWVSSPQISPDGGQIVFTRRWTDKINDKYETDIWIMDADGGRKRFLVRGSQPRWSPDGRRLAYIAQGQPTGAQIFVRWMDSGEATQLTRLERSPSNLSWSPDGRQIAFNMLVPAKPAMSVKMPDKPEGAKWVDAPRVVDRLNYRADQSGWRPEGFTHIFVIPDTGGTPRKLTDGDYQHDDPQWMMDSQTIVFSAVRKPEAEYVRGGEDIYALSTAGGGIRALTDRNGPDYDPTVSPDGRFIAYLGHDQNDNTYTVSKLYLMEANGANKRLLTGEFDREPGGLIWAQDGSGIYFTTEDRGTNNLWFEPVRGGAPTQVTGGNHQLLTSSISRGGRAVGVLSSAVEAGDVVTFTVASPKTRAATNAGDFRAPHRLTGVNDDLMEGRKLGPVEEIWYDSVGNKRIQGWIVKPPDFDASRKYPLMLYIHGGPHSMYGVGMNFEFQNHAAEGYIVLYTNPRGSTGYGQEFGNAINNNYPGEDYDDLMKGVDEVIRRGYIDERNLFVCGGSGGGVLTTWIVGHTDRFAAAVAMKPVINWYSFIGTTDSADWYFNFKKLPWEDPQEHLRRSPITYVGNVKTPTMLMTGELDLRTPMEQTEQFYRALKMRKVDTVMVRIADEYHPINAVPGLRHPSNRIQLILYLRGWFEKYRKK
ncbi:MAG TPA: S9 family peptidase [Pyrinomonadaceae bacterium]|jgi:dipeptidyl aminopeptidase/acylaminoacyl peptidase|nr:S9 family peptidase [Pyrinomonadaceae bacterium]